MQAYTAKNNVDLLAPAGGKKPSVSKKSQNNGEFLSMVLDAAASKANSGQKITEKDVKEIVKTVTTQKETLQKAQSESVAKISTALEENLDENTKNELYENANFMQLLQVLEILNGNEKVSKFPNFSDKIANFLSVPENVEELSNVKSVSDLIDLAKKFDLGLENIEISNEDVPKLNEMFKNLGKKEFFTPIKTEEKPFYLKELKNEVEQTIIKNEPKEVVKLDTLLKEVVANPTNETKNLVKEEPKKLDSEVKLDDEIVDVEPDEQPKVKVNLHEQKTQKAPTLESLLFPEREQQKNENFESKETFNSDNKSELNQMVKDIASSAKHQLQTKAEIKETLSNFSSTLKEQVQNYKAPITRFNITLNPLNLGEVEITMVNRGNNLHVNFNSTTATMNLFLQNQAEFKNSLVNMGFTELEMNFSDQNQRQDKKEQAKNKYSSNQSDESENAQAEQSLLELVIPRYI
ncbi:flagellar hook-length control protein FliK [Campylobacter concisus]|uniref:flagellar hook-length control protein FliK n=1 Tax=Campylobacter concisus TaxID=199 RepID=UPI0018AA7BA3|nr:flagellar hook-length control protein FliK [Campylobacter concisus]QPH98612.1 flagellar hook-length control protein FliK [Campylobacter concisus]QPI00366.1 flagellar hook-length control protein FliK [Campylobacter concisus]